MERGSDVWGKEGVEHELLQEEDARASRPPSEIRSYETTDAQGGTGLVARAKRWAKALKRQIVTLYLAYQHPLTPWYAKALVLLVLGYALSPIDLIPDFIPVLGYLDDIILVPAGIWLSVKLIPAHVWRECEEKAANESKHSLPKNYWVAGLIVLLYLVGIYYCVKWSLLWWYGP